MRFETGSNSGYRLLPAVMGASAINSLVISERLITDVRRVGRRKRRITEEKDISHAAGWAGRGSQDRQRRAENRREMSADE